MFLSSRVVSVVMVLPVLALAACAEWDADLAVKPELEVIAVGESTEVLVSGDVFAPADTEVEVSVFLETDDDSWQGVAFEWLATVPIFGSSLVTDRSGGNESEIAVVTLMDADDAIRVSYLVTCSAPFSGELIGSWRVLDASGNSQGGGGTEAVPFSCE